MMTDAKRVENLVGLSEVKSSTSELSAAAESAMSRRGVGVVPCLGSSEVAHRQDYEAKRCTDITAPVHKEHTQVVSSCKAQEEIYVDQVCRLKRKRSAHDIQTPSTVLVWIDGAWSGEPVSCKPLFAGAGRLKNHAIDAPRVSRWETSDCRLKKDRDMGKRCKRVRCKRSKKGSKG